MNKKVVVITGGARGIGKKLVEDFAKLGSTVYFCYNQSKDRAIELQKDLNKQGFKVYAFKADITDEKEVESFVEYITNNETEINVLVNNSAISNDSLFMDKNQKSFIEVLNTNLVGVFAISKIIGQIMYKQKRGKIINISSTNGIDTYFPMCAEYDASKAGLNSLTHNLAVQYAPYVNVNAVAPGFISTESEIKDMDDEFIRQEEDKILLRKAGTEEDVSNLVIFLAGDMSNYINNQIIKINGGKYGD